MNGDQQLRPWETLKSIIAYLDEYAIICYKTKPFPKWMEEGYKTFIRCIYHIVAGYKGVSNSGYVSYPRRVNKALVENVKRGDEFDHQGKGHDNYEYSYCDFGSKLNTERIISSLYPKIIENIEDITRDLFDYEAGIGIFQNENLAGIDRPFKIFEEEFANIEEYEGIKNRYINQDSENWCLKTDPSTGKKINSIDFDLVKERLKAKKTQGLTSGNIIITYNDVDISSNGVDEARALGINTWERGDIVDKCLSGFAQEGNVNTWSNNCEFIACLYHYVSGYEDVPGRMGKYRYSSYSNWEDYYEPDKSKRQPNHEAETKVLFESLSKGLEANLQSITKALIDYERGHGIFKGKYDPNDGLNRSFTTFKQNWSAIMKDNPDVFDSINFNDSSKIENRIKFLTRIIEYFRELWENLCKWWNEKFPKKNLDENQVNDQSRSKIPTM